MIRFFEPEMEPRWSASAAPPDHRLPALLPFPWESRVSRTRSDAVLPLPSSSTSESHHGSSSAANHISPAPPSSNTSAELEKCFQLQSSAPPVPTDPMNCIPGIGIGLMSSEATTNSRTVSGATSQQNAMQNPNVEREIAARESKRQKAATCMGKQHLLPSDEPGTSQTPSMETRVRRPHPKKSQKLGDRVTALQQLVSPFGKTDTASVLHEATIYIKALHEQIQVLTDPHIGIKSSPVLQGHGGQRLGLRQRGLCLVPISQNIINLTDQAPFDRTTIERTTRAPGVHLRLAGMPQRYSDRLR